MKQKSGPDKAPAEQVVKDIRRQTRRQCSGGTKDPHCAGRIARRGEHLGALPPGRHRRLDDVLRLVQEIPRDWQASVGGRHGAGRNVRRREGASS
jgi:hypothetical protein